MPIFVRRLLNYTPSKPRHPLLRLALGLLGVGLLAVLVVVGVFVGAGMLLFAASRRMIAAPRRADVQARVEGAIDGEYAVVHKQASLGVH